MKYGFQMYLFPETITELSDLNLIPISLLLLDVEHRQKRKRYVKKFQLIFSSHAKPGSGSRIRNPDSHRDKSMNQDPHKGFG